MSIDKSWTRLRNRNSIEFFSGLHAFLERCKGHLNDQNRCRCPCVKCDNLLWGTLVEVGDHVHRWGFSMFYKTLEHHGERINPLVHDPTDEMVGVLNDIRGENTNNEYHADFDETNNEPTEAPGPTADDLEELLARANDELYPGCKVSSLDFMSKLSHIKVMNKWTDSSFDQLLEYLKTTYPEDNKVPSSHYECKKTFKKIGLGYESIHACINDCCLFWGENKDKENCPICDASRWKDKDTMGKKVANKVLRYIPLTPRLKRMYNSRHTAKSMTWHATG